MVHLVRIGKAFQVLGLPKATGYERMQAGLLPKALRVGPRSSFLRSDEIDTLVAAHSAGCTEEQIRELVRRLESKRGQALAELCS